MAPYNTFDSKVFGITFQYPTYWKKMDTYPPWEEPLENPDPHGSYPLVQFFIPTTHFRFKKLFVRERDEIWILILVGYIIDKNIFDFGKEFWEEFTGRLDPSGISSVSQLTTDFMQTDTGSKVLKLQYLLTRGKSPEI